MTSSHAWSSGKVAEGVRILAEQAVPLLRERFILRPESACGLPLGEGYRDQPRNHADERHDGRLEDAASAVIQRQESDGAPVENQRGDEAGMSLGEIKDLVVG